MWTAPTTVKDRTVAAQPARLGQHHRVPRPHRRTRRAHAALERRRDVCQSSNQFAMSDHPPAGPATPRPPGLGGCRAPPAWAGSRTSTTIRAAHAGAAGIAARRHHRRGLRGRSTRRGRRRRNHRRNCCEIRMVSLSEGIGWPYPVVRIYAAHRWVLAVWCSQHHTARLTFVAGIRSHAERTTKPCRSTNYSSHSPSRSFTRSPGECSGRARTR